MARYMGHKARETDASVVRMSHQFDAGVLSISQTLEMSHLYISVSLEQLDDFAAVFLMEIYRKHIRRFKFVNVGRHQAIKWMSYEHKGWEVL